MTRTYLAWGATLLVLVLLPFLIPDYFLHIAIQILIWGLVYTGWATMGRFGLVSLGHGAFMGIGAYSVALLWNLHGVSPWLGMATGIVLAGMLAILIGYPCFHLRIVGHYFALVTLALGQVVLLLIVAARDVTGGSLGMTPRAVGHSWWAFQLPERRLFYFVALAFWLAGLVIRWWIDRGMRRAALEAIGEDEEAASAAGIDVLREKLLVTLVSAAVTACGGGLFVQYLMYVNPDTVSGVAVSLQIVFAAIAGGMYAAAGPTIGALLTIALTEGLRILFGTHFIGAANTAYGVLLILFTIFMPRGILGLFSRGREHS